MRDAMSPFLDIAENKLWRWKTFPIILPDPISIQAESGTTGQEGVYSAPPP